MSTPQSNDLRSALAGGKGELDAYLEVHSEEEVRSDFAALLAAADAARDRRMIAAVAMQGFILGNRLYKEECIRQSIEYADALISALEKTP